MTGQLDRRLFTLRAGASIAAIGIGAIGGAGTAFAQRPGGRTAPFGLPIPDALQSVLPEPMRDLSTTVEQIIALEREADLRRLPISPLSMRGLMALPLDADRLYELALPRLVALVDRGQRSNIPFADRAGSVLAQLHSSQRELPEALAPRAVAAVPGKPVRAAGRSGFALVDQVAVAPLPQPDVAPPGATTPEPVAEVDVAPTPEVSSNETRVPDNAEPENAVPEPPADLSRSHRFENLRQEYVRLFAAATLRPEHSASSEWHLTMLRQSRSRYAAVAARVAVPWYFIGAIHGLEASFNFRAHLHNGDFPLTARTRQVPAGRPTVWRPPSDWESSAIDAMRILGFAGQTDWSLARTLYRFEAYNGFGYRRRGVASPYLWSFSDQYDRGKFVADGRWSATARSQQCGAAVMLKLLSEAGEIDLS